MSSYSGTFWSLFWSLKIIFVYKYLFDLYFKTSAHALLFCCSIYQNKIIVKKMRNTRGTLEFPGRFHRMAYNIVHNIIILYYGSHY